MNESRRNAMMRDALTGNGPLRSDEALAVSARSTSGALKVSGPERAYQHQRVHNDRPAEGERHVFYVKTRTQPV